MTETVRPTPPGFLTGTVRPRSLASYLTAADSKNLSGAVPSSEPWITRHDERIDSG